MTNVTIPVPIRVVAYLAGGVGSSVVAYLQSRGIVDEGTALFIVSVGGTLASTLALAHLALPDDGSGASQLVQAPVDQSDPVVAPTVATGAPVVAQPDVAVVDDSSPLPPAMNDPEDAPVSTTVVDVPTTAPAEATQAAVTAPVEAAAAQPVVSAEDVTAIATRAANAAVAALVPTPSKPSAGAGTTAS